MLSYLHAYHAGNAADVLKHSALLFCLRYLKKKTKPLLCVDTHAGSGFYWLPDSAGSASRVSKNREWEKGMGRLLQAAGEPPPMIADYMKLSEAQRYPGSPVIMARELAGSDRLVCYELHPQEFEALKVSMEGVRNERDERPTIELRHEDGPAGLKSLLPPVSRRGLILIDPSWEEKSEYESIPRSVQEGLGRFGEGTFIIWYPLLTRPRLMEADVSLRDLLYGLSGGKRCRAELCSNAADDCSGNESSPRGMYGSGLVIYNPPWTLRSVFEDTLPYLALTLYNNKSAWHLDWDD